MVYPTTYSPGGPIPTGGVDVVISNITSRELHAAYGQDCETQGHDDAGCIKAVTQVVANQPALQKRNPAVVFFLFVVVVAALTAMIETLSPHANDPVADSAITLHLEPSMLSTTSIAVIKTGTNDPNPVTISEGEVTSYLATTSTLPTSRFVGT